MLRAGCARWEPEVVVGSARPYTRQVGKVYRPPGKCVGAVQCVGTVCVGATYRPEKCVGAVL